MPLTLFGDYPEHFVYLLRYGSEPIYKIGYTKRMSARLCEINLVLPYEVTPIRVIYTDDPRWLEEYWHQKFKAKRRWGSGRTRRSEWFDLTEDNVREFTSQPDIVRKSQDEIKPIDHQLCFETTGKSSTENDLWEKSAQRVIEYFDALIFEHPQHVIKLSNACSHQIKDQNAKVGRLIQKPKPHTLEQAIGRWEREAKRSADAKIHK